MTCFDNVEGEKDICRLIVIHCVANVTLGVSYLLWAQTSAENVLTEYFPGWFWPSMFIVAGVLAFVGLWSRTVARWSFAFAGMVMGVFSIASYVAIYRTGNLAIVPSAIFLTYLTVLKIEVALLVGQRQDIVQQLTATTLEAQSVLDRVTDGTTT